MSVLDGQEASWESGDPDIDAFAPGEFAKPERDTGGVLDDLATSVAQARRAHRRYLRDTWVKDTWLGEFLHLDQPDDPPAPTAAPALAPGWGKPPPVTLVPEPDGPLAPRAAPTPSPGWGNPPPVTLVPEPDTGGPPTTTGDARALILANRPRFPPTSWDRLQAPVQVYFWDPFNRQWTRVGDANGITRAKALVLMMIISYDFPVTYCLLHTSRGTEVIHAVENASTEPSGGDHFGNWRPIGGGVSRMWSPQFTFYSRTFKPGETMRFDLGRGADGETGTVPRTYTAEGGETPLVIAKRYDAHARARWAAELKAANPERDWTARIYAGDVIAIPEAWPAPFWGAAKERGYLDTSGPTGELAEGSADPFLELRARRA